MCQGVPQSKEGDSTIFIWSSLLLAALKCEAIFVITVGLLSYPLPAEMGIQSRRKLIFNHKLGNALSI